MTQIRVLLAEDHTIVRKGIRALLDRAPDIEVIGEAADGREAIDKTEQLNPDIVVMDISMPLLNGLEATRQIRTKHSNVRVLILTMYSNEEYIFQTLRAGASGYLVKETAPAELISAIRAAYQGESFLSPTISRKVIDEYIQQVESVIEVSRYDRLTRREREVLQLIAEGFTNREIAENLFISEKTARAHRANLMDKLDLHSTAELAIYAARKGVINLD